MFLEPLLMLLPLAAGVGAAQLTGPAACDWRAKPGQMKRRLMALKTATARGGARKAVGTAVLSAILAGGALAAYAAQPSAPEQLPAAVIGVVGSGDQISLQLRADGSTPARILRPGDEYKDGWTLQALTPSAATLAKDGAIQLVGLNPTGALPSAAGGAPSTVTVIGEQNAAEGAGSSSATAAATSKYTWGSEAAYPVAERLANWNGLPRAGLTVEETRRMITLGARALQTLRDQNLAAGQTMNEANIHAMYYTAQIAALGPDGPELEALNNKTRAASYYQALDGYNKYGPISITVPNAADVEAAKASANMPGAPWSVSAQSMSVSYGPDGALLIGATGPVTLSIRKPDEALLHSMLR